MLIGRRGPGNTQQYEREEAYWGKAADAAIGSFWETQQLLRSCFTHMYYCLAACCFRSRRVAYG